MRRRALLGGIAGGIGLGTAAWWLTRGSAGERLEPATYDVLYAPDGESELTMPAEGRVSMLEFFATSCTICASMMPHLATVADTIDPSSVQLVSITTEPIGITIDHEDVIEWWDEHDGHWPVISDHEHDRRLSTELEVVHIPRTVVLDESNRIVKDTLGYHDTDELLGMIDEARS